MTYRPVFVPLMTGSLLVEECAFEIKWAPGFADVQKKKNINSLHEEAKRHGIDRVLEISTKSDEEVGQKLSAFNIKLYVDGRDCYLESVYQGSKVFKYGGPHEEIFDLSPREARRYMRGADCGNLEGFCFEGEVYPLSPANAFYDWLYIRSIKDWSEWVKENVCYDGFTDIEFNPRRQINCQARAFAEYVSLLNRNKLQDAAEDYRLFSSMLCTI